MRLQLQQEYLGQPIGKIVDYPPGVGAQLIIRGIAIQLKDAPVDEPEPIAEPVPAPIDPDADGKAEGGEIGEKKAFTRPPKRK